MNEARQESMRDLRGLQRILPLLSGLSRAIRRCITFPLPIPYPSVALTGEGKAAILADDDWPALRTARRKKTESSARRRGRRGVPRAGAAFDLRSAWRAAHRSDPPDPHPCAGRYAGAVRFCLRAGKAFF